MGKIFVISDTHFYHSMVIREKYRDFRTVDIMNEVMINNWNRTVGKEDTVYHLGDVCIGSYRKFKADVLPLLNGNIIFVRGNHDSKSLTKVCAIKMEFQGKTFELVHSPENASFNTDYIIHGHIHNAKSRTGIYLKRKCYNCIVELHNYKPKLINEILGELNNCNWFDKMTLEDINYRSMLR